MDLAVPKGLFFCGSPGCGSRGATHGGSSESFVPLLAFGLGKRVSTTSVKFMNIVPLSFTTAPNDY